MNNKSMDKPNDASLYVLAACFMCIGLFLAHTYLSTPFAIRNSENSFALANKATDSIFNSRNQPNQSQLQTKLQIESKLRNSNFFFIKPFELLKLNTPFYSAIIPTENKNNIFTNLFSLLSITTPPNTSGTSTSKPPTLFPGAKNKAETATITENPIAIDAIINNIPTYESLQSHPDKSVVNILCRIYEGKITKNISSSGVVISNNGLILTNAHVAIHPFLEKYASKNISCIARNGSPATGSTPVEFVYISSNWTTRHKGEVEGILSQDSGENDFAILKIAPGNLSNIQKIPLRSPETLLNFTGKTQNNINYLSPGQSIRVFGYPIDTNQLYPLKLVDNITITHLYGFSGNPDSHELIETSPSKVGKSGASGGPIVDEQNYLIGIIANVIPVSDSAASTIGTNKIHGISVEYINSTLKNETGISLFDLTSGNISNISQISTVFENSYLNQVRSNLAEF